MRPSRQLHVTLAGSLFLILSLAFYLSLSAPLQAQGGCPDDPYEPNDSASQAPNLPAGTYPNLYVCPNNQDWFRISLPAYTVVDVSITFDNSQGDLDLYLMDKSGQRALTQSTSTNADVEHLTYTTTTSTTAYILVLGYNGASNAYTLTYTTRASDDPYEPNDNPAEAPYLTSGTYPNLMLVPGNADFFAVNLPARSVITVTAQFQNSKGDIDLWLTNRRGNTLRSSTHSDTDWEKVVYPTSKADLAYIYLRSYGHATNEYTLTIDIAVHWPCQEDSLAPNQTSADAAPIHGDVYHLVLCPNTEDWFRISVPEQGILDLWLEFEHMWADLDLNLMATDTLDVLAWSRGTTNTERIRYTVTGPSDYLVQVYTRQDIPVGSPYTMTYAFATFTPTPTPTPTPTATPTLTPTPTPTTTPTPTPTPTSTPTPTATPTASPTPSPTPVPPARHYIPLVLH